MISLAALIAAFLLILLTELGDKTQLTVMILAARYPPRTVFWGAFLALVTSTLLAVLVGSLLFSFLPIKLVRVLAALLFIAFGIHALLSKHEEEGPESQDGRKLFWRTFGLVFIAEAGDKTQLAVVALAASFAAPLEVFIGAVVAFALITAGAAWLGSWLGDKLNKRVMGRIGAILFIGIGVFLLIETLL